MQINKPPELFVEYEKRSSELRDKEEIGEAYVNLFLWTLRVRRWNSLCDRISFRNNIRRKMKEFALLIDWAEISRKSQQKLSVWRGISWTHIVMTISSQHSSLRLKRLEFPHYVERESSVASATDISVKWQWQRNFDERLTQFIETLHLESCR
jgi:hypothetical protein